METNTTQHVLTFEQIRDAISESLGIEPSEIELTSRFMRDLGADSLSLAQLMLDLEDDLGIEIPDDDAAMLFTPQDVLNYVNHPRSH